MDDQELKPLHERQPEGNHWEIKAIDSRLKKVEVFFRHKGHDLMHSLFVENIDKNEIVKAVEDHYKKFQEDLKVSETQNTPLSTEVSGLVGLQTKK